MEIIGKNKVSSGEVQLVVDDAADEVMLPGLETAAAALGTDGAYPCQGPRLRYGSSS